MIFEKAISLIEGNRDLINEWNRTRPENYVYDFLLKCVSLLEEEDPAKIDETFICDFQGVVDTFVNIAIKIKTSQDEKVVLKAISDVLYNVYTNYNIECDTTKLNALVILTDTAKSLEDILYILLFMFNKLSHTLYDESSNDFISRKFYTELNDFLNTRKSHDEKYDI